MLTMRIRKDGAVQGYLVFTSTMDENAFDCEEILLLNNLKEHILSAYAKMHVLQELKDLNKKKNELLGIVAHDLRNPLGLISSWTSITIRNIETDRFSSERGLRILRRVMTVAEQTNRLVAELLDISAIESGKLSLQLRSESISTILEECKPLYASIAEEKGISLTIDPGGEHFVRVDRSRILEALDNLLGNAIKFTFPGGRIQVFCEDLEDEVIVHIRDTGQGLSSDDLKLVFNKFGKLSSRPTGGEPSTGLGLAIAKKVIEMHGGRIWVASEKGKGATFSFSLPVSSGAAGSRSAGLTTAIRR
jgi:signal transduction histidine kinase